VRRDKSSLGLFSYFHAYAFLINTYSCGLGKFRSNESIMLLLRVTVSHVLENNLDQINDTNVYDKHVREFTKRVKVLSRSPEFNL
jgi:hypothetical protein